MPGEFFQTFDEKDLLKTKLEILSKTKMIDYTIDITMSLYPDSTEVLEVRN